ncbi:MULTISPECIES: SH3 domain-containing protein [unclassified Mammaliicoccus]|uniref:SH3 domain-containing protein n=1 Tax=unclassified Mammaliicoccus TaxID=2803851 RepID=UPI001EFA7793|nr:MULTISPECIES: SH3 domain-containing protein [unclassified Mammaliicoccus]
MAKTQAEIVKRLEAYKNGTVDSPYRIKTKTYREPDFLPMEPGSIDVDKRWNAQCMDEVIDYVLWFTDNKIWLKGNAIDVINNNLEPYFTWHKNTPEYVPSIGSIGVNDHDGFEKYGHIYIVYSDANTETMIVLEQNWNSNANLPPKLRKDNYRGCAGFWVPNVAKDDKKVGKELKYNRDEVTGYQLPNRGYKPKGIVIHNDAGSQSAMQYHDSLVNASLSRLEAGIAHSYISDDSVWQALPESRIAWHTANENGNTNFYGIEVCQSMSASDQQFLDNEQSAFQEAARLLKKWGLPVDRSTVRLHNEFSSTQCPHRSMALHAGYTSSQRAPQDVVNKTKDYFISQIKAYYEGEIPEAISIVETHQKSNNVGDWQQNQYGTWWKVQNATFTCGAEPILNRIDAPSLLAPEGYWFQPGGYANYDEVCLRDGYVWIGYTWQYTRYYLPVRTWDGTPPPNHIDGLGDLWGTIN